MNFKHYKRTGLSEMIAYEDFEGFTSSVSISEPDKKLRDENYDEFKQGFIARNPKNHEDLWYVSKKYFDENLEEVEPVTSNLTFGQAVEALKQGKRIARQGWNGKGMFVFMQVPSEIAKDIVPKMQSLPQSVKDEFQKRFENSSGSIYYSNQLALVNPSNLINGWAPSVSDALAEDWVILD
jgi:hypothetical protein